MSKCICEKCKHFIQHYSFEYGVIRKIYCGHCMKTGRNCNMSCTHTQCDKYEPEDINQKYNSVKTYLIDYLKNIEQQLQDLKMYINKDA